ncbi:MAG: DUF433 domain-containing protein [Chloroflexota bacterium]
MQTTVTTVETDAANYPHIVRNPKILGGEPSVRGTRIPVRSLVTSLRRYGTPAQVAGAYALPVDVVEEGLAYYAAHREEIDGLIQENERAAGV